MAASSDKITLRDLMTAMDRIEDKMDERLTPLEKRVREVEGNQSKAFGVIGFVSIFISAGAAYVWEKILGKN